MSQFRPVSFLSIEFQEIILHFIYQHRVSFLGQHIYGFDYAICSWEDVQIARYGTAIH